MINMNYKKYIKFAFLILLSLLLCYNVYYIYISYILEHSWQLSDWLINYEDGGFKRRGLGGSLFFLIQSVTYFKLDEIVFVTISILQILFFIFYYLNSKKNINIGLILLMLSPLCFGFWLVDKESVDRKEIILFFIASFLIYKLKNNKNDIIINYIFPVLIVIATLIHEYVIFFIPYFLMILFLNEKKSFNIYIAYFLSAFVPALLILLFGKLINEGESLNIIKSKGVILLNGGIFALPQDFKFEIYKENFFQLYGKYFISFAIGLIYFYIYLKKYTNDFLRKKVLLYFVISFLYSLPLFYMAGDWGRWLNIHFTLLLIIVSTIPTERENINKFSLFFMLTVFLWGFNVLGDGFHFYTKFNLFVGKIFNYLF